MCFPSSLGLSADDSRFRNGFGEASFAPDAHGSAGERYAR
jgi:hypothetical protein